MSASPARPLWRDLLLASRPLSWINTAFGFAAAYLLTAGSIDLAAILGTVYFLVPYNLAMYGINDVFDYESDLRNPRKDGVEGAVLDPRRHRAVLVAVVATNAPFLIALVLLGTPVSDLVLAVSVFAVIAYSAPRLRAKEVPVLDSITSSVHFVSPMVFGLALAGAVPTLGLIATVAAFTVWGMATHAFGAVQDIVPDREGGIASIATVLGARRTVRLSIGLWMVSGLLMLASQWPGPLAGLLSVGYIALAWPFRALSDADAARAHQGWVTCLRLNYLAGFLVTMLLIWWQAVRV